MRREDRDNAGRAHAEHPARPGQSKAAAAPSTGGPPPPHLALVVSHPDRTGGMETFCRFLARTALEAGWRITVALSGENLYRPLASAFPGRLAVDEVNWLDRTCTGDREYGLRRIRARREWFRRIRPATALFVQSSNTPFRAAVVGARLAGVPVVTTHRTMAWPPDESPSRRHFLGLVPGLGLHRRRAVARTWLTAFLANRIVFNSEDVRRGYEAVYGFPADRGMTIPNAVLAPAAPHDACAGAPGRPVTLGFAGRLGADKRLDILLQAVARMEHRDAVRVAFRGQGAERPALAALSAELGIADRVEWRGLSQDPGSLDADMDVVVLCSPRESSSNMILEAMAAGKAVVVSRTGGMPELVSHGECGICVPPLDPALLAMVLDKLAASPNLRRRLGERARDKAVREHDPRLIAARWMALLGSVAGVGRARPSVLRPSHEHSMDPAGRLRPVLP